MTSTSISSPWNNRPSTLIPPAPPPSTGAGAPPPARTGADASPRICLSSARRGRRRSPALLNLTVIPPALRAMGVSPTSTHAVRLPSMMRCSRPHVANGSCRRLWGGASAASNTTSPKFPACRTSVSALMARSSARWFTSRHKPGFGTTWPRTQSSRARSTPAASADAASSMSRTSTSATISRRAVAAASIRSSTLARPVDRAPTTSDIWPRGNPPPSRASNAVTPVDAVAYSSVPPDERAGSPGRTVVRVRSSFRSRRRASRSARASDIGLSLSIRLDLELYRSTTIQASRPGLSAPGSETRD